jgi:hypothetical protein
LIGRWTEGIIAGIDRRATRQQREVVIPWGAIIGEVA